MVKRSLTMKTRDRKKMFLLYPDDKMTKIWELLTTITLILTCLLTPTYIAFHDGNEDDSGFSVQHVNLIIDMIFGIDIIVVFFSPYYNDDFRLIDEPK